MNAEFNSLALPACCAVSMPNASLCCARHNAAVDDAPALITVLVSLAEAGVRFLARSAPAALKGAATARE